MLFTIQNLKHTYLRLLNHERMWKYVTYSGVEQKTLQFENVIYFRDPILIIFLVKIRTDHNFFFAHVFGSIGLVFKKLQAKTYFFTFSKTLKNTYMTSKIHPPKHWHYEFFSYFGFGSKHSKLFFPAIQNVIWSRFDDFRHVLK